MQPERELGQFLALAQAAATHDDGLLETALPPLRDLVSADAALVVIRSAQGLVRGATAGLALPIDDVELPEGREGLVEMAVPAAWSTAGIRSARAQLLPGHAGVLVLGWTAEASAEGATVEAAVAVLDSGLARLHAEERLADLVQRVDHAQHLAGMGDYDWHIPSDTNQWSDQLFRIYGYEPQAFNVSYERFLGNIHPDDRERIQRIHQHAHATGEPYQMVERIVRPDGEIRYLSSNGEVIMDGDGNPVRMRGTCIDVTEHILAERETERAAERFRGLVESSPEAILVLDLDSNVLQANANAAGLLGADPAGHSLDEILPQESWTGGQGVEATALDGSAVVLDITTAGLTEATHEGRTAVFLRDASPRLEREALAARLGESQQRRKQALEINDNVVQGLTSAVYSLEHEDIRQASSYIERTLAAARNIMDDLLEPSGEELHPGDLVRSSPARLEEVAPDDPALGHGPTAPSAHRVLIVDDAEDIRALLRIRLNRQDNIEVVGEAVDGLDAVDQARQLQPNLVLLDMAMPRMDGLQALPLIREAVPDVHVIVLSGFNQATLEQEALAAGADRYVVKGGSMNDLMKLIETVLEVA